MNTRIQHKHDIEANWNKAVNFIPRVGELIVYDVDDSYEYPRVKIGDGVRVISELPFITKEITNDFTDEYKFKVDSALQFETDPTVPAWAKATTKPAYTKSEVGLGNVDNVKQYSASNPPVVVQPDAPSDTSVIWVDTDDDTDDIVNITQVQPLFANSIEECTDTSKLYVLPDGYIYAHMTETGALYTNQIENAINADGTPYNDGLGYKTGYSFDSAYNESAVTNGVVTGFIPYKTRDGILRVAGYTTSVTDVTNSNNNATFEYVVFYDANFNAISQQRGRVCYYTEYDAPYEEISVLGSGVYGYTLDWDVIKAKTGWWTEKIIADAAYVRFSLSKPELSALTVTIGEEIAFGSEEKWMNTGHAFIPADYEDRIIPLEKTTESHEKRIKALELYGTDSTSSEDIPAYIKTEADSVMNRLIEKQGSRSHNVTLVGMSDFHYSGMGDNKDNLIRACKAISYMQSRIHIDAIATLGDNTPNGSTYDESIRTKTDRWHKEINEILAMTQKPGVIDFRTPGNHDAFGTTEQFMPENALYTYIGGYNRQCDYVNAPIGYAYKDFNGYNLRVIVLNTAETEGKGRFADPTSYGYHISTKQYKWLIDTLDLSDKPNAADWQILILSHHRADDHQCPAKNTNYEYILPNILNAYNTGGSYSAIHAEDDATISCNFAGKNAAKLIGQIHGHHHDYEYGKLLFGATGSTQTNVLAIGTPTSSFITNGNGDNEGNTYSSVKDTAQETAFCVYSIDLDNRVIHAIHYGNGIDREINY